MSVIVQTVVRWIKGFILLYGIYIVLYGHITPGGGFAGGVVIAGAFIILTIAGGEKYGLSFFSRNAASSLDSVGVLMFLSIAWAGMAWTDGAFFQNFISTPEQQRFTLFSAGTIPLANISLGLKVASSLFLVFTVLAALRLAVGGEQTRDDET
jgi:multisubunit Na+/H+ antiporter MnhB subunit